MYHSYDLTQTFKASEVPAKLYEDNSSFFSISCRFVWRSSLWFFLLTPVLEKVVDIFVVSLDLHVN